MSKKPLTLLQTEIRPQEPTSFPYKQEEVVFTNPKSKDQISGTLTLPTAGKLSKIVILIAGSGPNNRDEELKTFNQKPFLVWSDFLTRNGIGVFRYDKRGIGKSTGDYLTATTFDFESDALAAVNYILSRPDLKNLEIGLMGHSEGGLIAPMVASINKNVKFLVLLAGPGVPIPDLMVKQNADYAKLQGANETQLKQSQALNEKIYALVNSNKTLPTPELNSKLEVLISDQLKTAGNNKLTADKIQSISKSQAASITTPWFRTFLSINPADYLDKVSCPVLALDGSLDFQVNAEANLAAIKTSLEKGGNKNFEIAPMEGLNHLLQKAKTGSLNEYGEIQETVDPTALNKVLDWISKLP
jgi:alpha-beta hydrolase superfamily lysophospholipase